MIPRRVRSPEELKAARHALGFSADGLARMLRIEDGRTIRRWEAGEREIPGPVIVLMETAMGYITRKASISQQLELLQSGKMRSGKRRGNKVVDDTEANIDRLVEAKASLDGALAILTRQPPPLQRILHAKPTFDEELKPDADDLLFFVDDTGHETFAGNQGFYGLGGCAVLGAGYAHLKERWRAVRKAINNDPELPLHASKLKREADNFAVLSKFFLDPSFVRIAVTTTKAIRLPPGMDPCVPVMGQIQNEIAFVAAVVPCKKVWIIVESSERADTIVQACFSQLTPINGVSPLPVVKSLMPKSSNEPGLEVADFIVSAASSEVQRRLRGQQGHAPDFNDVFCRLPIVGCRYREVSHVAVDENGFVSVTGVALVP